uniref:putative RING-H2 finger protein ATL21B n=1 Tax=Fragaria vesca subsp. vesca TaxID=101020 RepID=UPI0005CA5140|nr:PREDICTED: putative RING-H2 finger protein ATL21B [Fragaria vesca subsp. vesca]
MATIITLLPFFFCFFFLPQLAANSCYVSPCAAGGQPIRFPFRLIDQQPPSCGYSTDFDLSCNELKQTIFTLPSSGDFIVESISYTDQFMRINDGDNCTIKRFLDKKFTLLGSPFQFSLDLQEYTFYKCKPQRVPLWWYPISCLSNDNYEVVGVVSRSTSTIPSGFCDVITTAMVPAESFYESTNSGVKLTWNVPDCGSCELSGNVCGETNVNIATSGLSKAAKYGIAVGVLIPGLLSITCCALYVSSQRGQRPERNRGRLHEITTELSGTVFNRHPQVLFIPGLDSLTIASYPKTQLGESLELPNPNDKTCPICLGEYQPKETLRTIPECNHYFHSNCIDEWLGKNPTCPLCRKLPAFCRNPPEVSLVRPHDDYAIY